MPEFDYLKALRDGHKPEDVAQYLSTQTGFNFRKAMGDGHALVETIEFMSKQPTKPAEEVKEEVELTGREEFAYVWDNSSNMSQRAGMWLQSRMPLPSINVGWDGVTVGPAARFDSEEQEKLFHEASPEERLTFLKNRRREDVLLENPKAAEAIANGQEVENGWAMVAREVWDPASIIAPAGHGVKGMAIMSGLLGSSYETVRQAYEQEDMDIGNVLLAGAMGAVGGAAMGKVMKEAPELVRAIRGKPTKSAIRKADENMVRFESDYLENMAEVIDDPGIWNNPKARQTIQEQVAKDTYTNLGMDEGAYNRMVTLSTRQPDIPLDSMQAKKALQMHNDAYYGTVGTYQKMGAIERLIGSVDTRVGMISKPIQGRLATYEFNVKKGISDRLHRVSPFIETVKKGIHKSERAPLERALANGKFDVVEDILKNSKVGDDAVEQFKVVRKELDAIYTDMKLSGVEINKLPNYFPRQIKNYKKFEKAFLKKMPSEREPLKLALMAEAKKQGIDRVEDLSDLDRSNVINQHLRGLRNMDPAAGKPNAAKARKIDEITEEMQGHYHNATDSLILYITQATKAAEKYKFFGRNKGKPVMENGRLALDKSIGKLVGDEKLGADQVADLQEILKARFGMGEKSPHTTLQHIRNLGYMATLANPYSAAIQLSDIGLGKFATRGDMIPAMLGSASKKQALNMDDLGLDNHIAEELSSGASSISWSAKALDRTLGMSGFKAADRLGKESIINAGFVRDGKILRAGGKAAQDFRAQWKDFYGDDYQGLVQDLQEGLVTDRTKLHAWNTLSGVQPVSPSSASLANLNNPDMRIAYALKSFGLKQLDLVRREIVHEYRRGHKTKAAMNAGRFVATVTTMGTSVELARDLVMGREVKPEDIPDEFAETLLKTAFASKYTLNKITEGSLTEVLAGVVMPPLNIFEHGIKDAGSIYAKATEGKPIDQIELMKDIPVAGKIWDNFFNGGLERANERRRRDRGN